MGCDIHLFVEVKKDGKWCYHPVQETCLTEEFWDEEKKEPMTDYDKLFAHPLYVGRNYDLFAILANVRNGRGFAGVVTGDGFKVIARPRGVPKDASIEYLAQVGSWCNDGHSHSYLTLHELQMFDWDQKTRKTGIVDEKEFKVYLEHGRPESWCGGVRGSLVVHVSEEEMKKRIEQPPPFDGKSYYCQIEWEIKYRDHCQRFLNETLPALAQLGSPEDVRIVFFFDN